MTIKEVYRDFLLQSQKVYPLGEATAITDLIFEHIHIKKADLIKNPNQPITRSTNYQIGNYLEQVLQHKPVQYILGEVWFHGIKLKVNEHVLIPRPETEELVELTLSIIAHQPPGATILDIGTGSGCIPIALKKQLHAADITGIDVSNQALLVAKENAANQNMHIKFFMLDFLDEPKWKDLSLFDVIVSNPPYIPLNEKETMGKNVIEYEPGAALFVPDEMPLLFYEKIAAFGKEHLNYNGKVFVEIHENFADKTAAVFKANNYTFVDIKKDMFGKDRMVMARY